MGYIKAIDVLPVEIMEQIQEYIDGEMIYIPKKEIHKKSWGENTDTKKALASRNGKIFRDYQSGMSLACLSEKYYLAEKSIQRIVRQEKRNRS